MKKFFKKVGRFLKKVWQFIKRVVAIILALIIIVAVVTLFLVATPLVTAVQVSSFLSSLAASAAPLLAKIGLDVAIKITLADLLLAATISAGIGFLTMPNTMAWALSRGFEGLRYIGTKTVETGGEILQEAGNQIGQITGSLVSGFASSPGGILALGFLGYMVLKRTENGQPIISIQKEERSDGNASEVTA